MSSPLTQPSAWDLVASPYAEEIVPVFEPYARAALELAAPPGTPRLPAGSRIVDVACGPGTLAMLAARDGYDVDAIDFSPGMIAALETEIAARGGVPGRITPRVGDGQALPYPDGRFAAGFSLFGLMFFPDRALGFAELRRVLAPGARAVISSWHPLEAVPILAAMFGALREVTSTPGAPAPQAPPPPLITADACRSEMSAAFADVEIHEVRHVQRHPSIAAAWAGMQRTTAPVALTRERLGPERWAEVSRRVLDMLVSRHGEAPIEIEMPAWLAVGSAR